MPAVTGVLFKWPLIRQIRGRGYCTGMKAMSDKARATIPLIRKDQPKYPSKRNSPSLSFFAAELLAGSLLSVIALHWRCPEAVNPPLRKRESHRLLSNTAKSCERAMAANPSAIEREDMKIRRLITLLVGITSVALSPMTWAAGHGGGGGGGHGGGGGFHGGGFGGGGFRGGGFHGGGFRSSGFRANGFHGNRFHHGNFNDRIFFFNGFGDQFSYYPYYGYYPYGYYPYSYYPYGYYPYGYGYGGFRGNGFRNGNFHSRGFHGRSSHSHGSHGGR